MANRIKVESKTKLVLGHAGKDHADAVTLDIDPEHGPDVVHDLNIMPLPFEDNRFEEVICHHVLEHLNDLRDLMGELHRICKPDGKIYIEVPHHSSWCANTPNHKLRFSFFAFDGYIDKGLSKWITGRKFKIIRRELTFHKTFRKYFLNKIFNKYPMAYERFWTYICPAEFLRLWIQPIKQ